eukprot:COSAG06_NODE_2366_length_7002_cov_11.463277_4_plen_46_part_00
MEVARLLLFSGADCELRDRSGATSFMVACEQGAEYLYGAMPIDTL